jgi:membrane dipeptidase
LIGVDYIGIGADYDGVNLTPVGVEDVSTYPHLFRALIDNGWKTEELVKLAGANILRVLKDNEKVRFHSLKTFLNQIFYGLFNFIVCRFSEKY